MLVLTRKKNETIIIDGQIKIEVLKIKGNTIRLGISAPSDVKVLRGELSPIEVEVPLEVETPSTPSELEAVDDSESRGDRRRGRTLSEFMNATEDESRLPNPFAVVAAV